MDKLFVGIDECGRGAVVGPMIIGAFVAPTAIQQDLFSLNVRDSKLFSGDFLKRFRKRTRIINKIMEISLEREDLKGKTNFYSCCVGAKEIDSKRRSGINLDEIERMAVVELLEQILLYNPSVELFDVTIDGAQIFSKIKVPITSRKKWKITTFDKADETNVFVAAASIYGKIIRDSCIISLMKENACGGGYTNKQTEDWINSNLEENLTYVRETWNWVKERFNKNQ